MKVGTDAVLLGAWTTIEQQPFSILDIGSGTGILALMMAQRSNAELIDAIEFDDDAFEQCVDNFEDSPWKDRLYCYHATLEEFTEEIEDKYDLIICNPPFYTESYKTKNIPRDFARFEDSMPFTHLLKSASILLNNNGILSVIIPYKSEKFFIEIALRNNLFPEKILHTKGTPTSEIKRSLIRFKKTTTKQPLNNEIPTNTLIIETERHQYTQDYINLTKDFYLKM